MFISNDKIAEQWVEVFLGRSYNKKGGNDYKENGSRYNLIEKTVSKYEKNVLYVLLCIHVRIVWYFQ